MITLKNVKTLQGKIEDIFIDSATEETVDAKGKLLLLPGLIDGHVHFRTPGAEHKENWISGARAAIQGGITTVFDMPNNSPPCVDLASLKAKKTQIDAQLRTAGIPLRYFLYLGADKQHLESMGQVKKEVAGIKIYMGSSTGGLIVDDQKTLDLAFRRAAQSNLIVAVHAEDEAILKERKARYGDEKDPAVHSKIRDRCAAIKAAEQAISLAEKHNSQLFIMHVSTQEEVELIRQAKRRQLLVYAETTPHHLFLTEKDYQKWGTKVQVNPPLRTQKDQEALWEGIYDGTIDTIGSDHAPHTLEEKKLPYGQAPSGIPGIETTLPLLLNAAHEKRITLEKIVALMRINQENIFNLPRNSDVVLVDLALKKEVKDSDLKTKCAWSPYAGQILQGWPIYTIINGTLFKVNETPHL